MNVPDNEGHSKKAYQFAVSVQNITHFVTIKATAQHSYYAGTRRNTVGVLRPQRERSKIGSYPSECERSDHNGWSDFMSLLKQFKTI